MADTPYVRDDVAAFLAYLNAQEGPKMSQLSAVEARGMMQGMRELADAEVTPLATVKDLTCPGPAGPIPVRLYDKRAEREAGPALVFFHGGGWVIGNIDTHEPFCSHAAEVLDMPIISVDYRMGPEHVWPAAPDDCEAVARWVASNPPELGRQINSLTLGGDSAGGNLTIITAIALRDNPADVPVIAQLPIYPATDLARHFASMDEFADGYFLTKDSMDWFGEQYAADVTHPRASPALVDQANMPPAVVVTASLDPIRDQGRLYAELLSRAGVDHVFLEMTGTIHGFICLRKALPSAVEDVDRLLYAFRSLVHKQMAGH